MPHKLVLSPIVELPFGEGKRWATEGIAKHILGDWTLSSIISIESGFPIAPPHNVNTTNLFNRVQWVNEGSADPATSGDRDDRLQPACGSTRPAYALAGALLVRHPGPHDTRTSDAAPQQLGLRRGQGSALPGRRARRSCASKC